MNTIGSDTKLTAVIGMPVRHSLSPLLHNRIYENEKIDAVMLAFGNDSIEELIHAVRTLPIHMVAVTLPHKKSVMAHLDHVDAVAKKIGAVNTIILRDGSLFGYNTDHIGIAKSLKDVELKRRQVLIAGAGGAARPVAYFLQKAGAKIFCHNRSRQHAEELCSDFGGTAISDLSSVSFDVIVNTTPVGMSGALQDSPIPSQIIRSGSTVFDIVYTPLETKLLRDAKRRGARAISGIDMFVAQGLEQDRLWLGRSIRDRDYARLLKSGLKKK
jgi:shikimate dehydrogenase